MLIKCAAILHSGKIYEGPNHPTIGIKMVEDGVCTPPYPGQGWQGFVTECGLYVNRTIGMSIAIASGQVSKDISHRQLYSEDLKT